MNSLIVKKRNSFVYRAISLVVAIAFFATAVIPPSYAQSITALNLPMPGVMVVQSPAFVPVLLKGMTIHPEDPFRFDFIVDSGNTDFEQDEIKKQSEKLVKYFLASMTIPKDDLWVNLSPYESDRIIPDELGKTELGRDMLAQDYLLKQLTASLMYPEDELGNEFWNRVYAKAQEKFGTTETPMNTFNKVWIIPEGATVYENDKTVYVVESRLKVLLDEDYVAFQNNTDNAEIGTAQLADSQLKDSSSISSQIVREIILPEIEKEINEGENFAPLRQIYHSLILSKWYKETIKNSLLSKIYIDQKKTTGVELDDQTFKEQIYDQYMQAYKKGVFDFIKEDYDQLSQEVIPREYFSGGEKLGVIPIKKADDSDDFDAAMVGDNYSLGLRINPKKNVDAAMVSFADKLKETDRILGSDNASKMIAEDLSNGNLDINNKKWVPILTDVLIAYTKAESEEELNEVKQVFDVFFAGRFGSVVLLLESIRNELGKSNYSEDVIDEKIKGIFEEIVYTQSKLFASDDNRQNIVAQLKEIKADDEKSKLQVDTINEYILEKYRKKFENGDLRMFDPKGEQILDFEEVLNILRKVNVAVGIPSYKEEERVKNPTQKAFEGLTEYFDEEDIKLLGNFYVPLENNTAEHFEEEIKRLAKESGNKNVYSILVSTGFNEENEPVSGKGYNFKNFFELLWLAKEEGSLRGAAVVDADLKTEIRDGVEEGITKEWIKKLLFPIVDYEKYSLQEKAQFVTPVYSRHEYDGSLTNSFITPLMNLAFGTFVRQPIGGDFGFAPEALEKFLFDMDWNYESFRFGIDISMSLTVAFNKLNLVETVLGSKIHDPSGPKLHFMIPEVFGAAVKLLSRNKARWGSIQERANVPRVKDGEVTPPQGLQVDYGTYKEGFFQYFNVSPNTLLLKNDLLTLDEILQRAANWGVNKESLQYLLSPKSAVSAKNSDRFKLVVDVAPQKLLKQRDWSSQLESEIFTKLSSLKDSEEHKLVKESWETMIVQESSTFKSNLLMMKDYLSEEIMGKVLDVLIGLGINVSDPWIGTRYLLEVILWGEDLIGEDISYLKSFIINNEWHEVNVAKFDGSLNVPEIDQSISLAQIRDKYEHLQKRQMQFILSHNNFEFIQKEIRRTSNEFYKNIVARLIQRIWNELGILEDSQAFLYFREHKTFASDLDLVYLGPQSDEVNLRLTSLMFSLGIKRDIYGLDMFQVNFDAEEHLKLLGARNLRNMVSVDINGYFEKYWGGGTSFENDEVDLNALNLKTHEKLREWQEMKFEDVDYKDVYYVGINNLLRSFSLKYSIKFGPYDEGYFNSLRQHLKSDEVDTLIEANAIANQILNIYQLIGRRRNWVLFKRADVNWAIYKKRAAEEIQKVFKGQGLPDLVQRLSDIGKILENIRYDYLGDIAESNDSDSNIDYPAIGTVPWYELNRRVNYVLKLITKERFNKESVPSFLERSSAEQWHESNKYFMTMYRDKSLFEAFQVALPNLRKHIGSKPLSLKDLIIIFQDPSYGILDKIGNRKIEFYVLYEFMSFLETVTDIQIDDEVKKILFLSEEIFSNLMEMETEAKLDAKINSLRTLPGTQVIVILKWLANVADMREVSEGRQDAARRVLRNFVAQFFSDSGFRGKSILDIFANLVTQKINKITSANRGIKPQDILVVPLLTSADNIGAYVENKIKDSGVRFKPLLFTTAMGIAFGREKEEDGRFKKTGLFTNDGKIKAAQYLRQEGIIGENVKHIMFLDIGGTGTLRKLIHEILQEEGISSDLLLISRGGSTKSDSDKETPYGVNDFLGNFYPDIDLNWYSAIFDDGFDYKEEIPYVDIEFADDGLIKVASKPTVRKWFANYVRQKIKEISLAEVSSEKGQIDLGVDLRGLLMYLSQRNVNQPVKRQADRVVLSEAEKQFLKPEYDTVEQFWQSGWREQHKDATVFYLVRHMESVSNVRGVTQSRYNFSPGTPRGYLQAQAMAEFLRNVKFDDMVSSDSERAYETLKILWDIQKKEGELPFDYRLAEFDLNPVGSVPMPIAFQVFDPDKLYLQFPNEYMNLELNSLPQNFSEVRSFFRQFQEEQYKGRTVAIGTHMHAIRTQLMNAGGIPIDKIFKVTEFINSGGRSHPNAGVSILAFHPDSRKREVLVFGDGSFIPDHLKVKYKKEDKDKLAQEFKKVAEERRFAFKNNNYSDHPIHRDYYPRDENTFEWNFRDPTLEEVQKWKNDFLSKHSGREQEQLRGVQRLVQSNSDADSAMLSSSPVKQLTQQPELRSFIEKYLTKRYVHWGLPQDLARNILDALSRNVGDIPKARREIYQNIINFDENSEWKAAYERYKNSVKYNSAYNQIRTHLESLPQGALIVDLGAGNNVFGATITENLPSVEVVGVDVIDYHEDRGVPNLRYLQQTSPTKIPEAIKANSVDVLTMNAVLHHVSGELVDELMKEITRVLKPGGRLILIEDTFSAKLPVGEDSDDELNMTFLSLVKKYGDQFAKDFFAFNDWYANILVHKWDDMATPYEFKSIEEWQELFKQNGFSVSDARNLGFPSQGFHKPGLGILVFKKVDVRTLDSLIASNPEWTSELSVLKNKVPTIIRRKQQHVQNVLRNLFDLSEHKYEALHDLLPEKERGKKGSIKYSEEYQKYSFELNKMSKIYDTLSTNDEDKEALFLTVMFHDIGARLDERDWTHNKTGSREVKSILQELGYLESTIERVSQLIKYHGLFSNVGVDFFPNEYLSLSKPDKDILMLMSFLDISGTQDNKNTASLDLLKTFQENHNKLISDYANDSEKFVKYRLGHFLTPFTIFPMSEDKIERNYHRLLSALKERKVDMSSFIENWSKIIRVNVFGIFLAQAFRDEDFDSYVDLVAMVNDKVNELRKSNSELEEIVLETNIDFMSLKRTGKEGKRRERILSYMRNTSKLENGIPMSFEKNEFGQDTLVLQISDWTVIEGSVGTMEVRSRISTSSDTVVIYLHGMGGDINNKVGQWLEELPLDMTVVRYTSSRLNDKPEKITKDMIIKASPDGEIILDWLLEKTYLIDPKEGSGMLWKNREISIDKIHEELKKQFPLTKVSSIKGILNMVEMVDWISYTFGDPDVLMDSGVKSFQDEQEDLRLVVDEIIKQVHALRGEDPEIILVGESLGGTIVPILAHELEAKGVKGVVSIAGNSGYDSMPDPLGHPITREIPDSQQMRNEFEKFIGKALIIRMTGDKSERNESAAKWPNNPSVVDVQGGHNINSSGPETESEMKKELKQFIAPIIKGQVYEKAMISDVGGIDMNDIKVEHQGKGVDIQFDPAMMQDILINGVDGFVPVIINLTPIISIMPLLGLEKTEPQKPSKRITRIDPYLSDEPRNREEE